MENLHLLIFLLATNILVVYPWGKDPRSVDGLGETISNNMKYNILMFNMSEFREWKSGIVNRNSHILHNLLKQDQIDKILSVDFLPFTKKRALRIYFQSVLKSHGGKRIKQNPTSKLTQISDKLYTYSTIDALYS